MGYHRAGFEVVGVDIEPQPNYPFEFIQDDVTEFGPAYTSAYGFDAIHASPPCQHYANVTSWRGDQEEHPDLIGPVRELLEQTGLPWVIENVRTDALRHDFVLCGSMFGLPIRRHRYFETSWHGFDLHPSCQHRDSDLSFDHGGKQPESVYRDAMGCEWMTVWESREAIPPVYTEHIGHYLMREVESLVSA